MSPTVLRSSRGVRLTISLLVACAATLLAIAAGVHALAFASRWRLEQRMLETVRQANVTGDTFNIYYFGGSTMVGEPYAPELSVPQLVEALLAGQVSGRPVRSVNLAHFGTDLAYTVDRVRHVVRHRTVTHPSLVVIYSGHNEFLKYSGPTAQALAALPRDYVDLAQRLDQLADGLEIDERHLLDRPVLNDDGRGRVVELYRSRMAGAVAALGQYGIPVIVSTVAGNYADWEPNRSAACSHRESIARFNDSFQRGLTLEGEGKLRAALAAYQDALALCDEVAELHFRVASCRRQLGEPAHATSGFERAVDLDGMPIRATGAINAVIHGLKQNPNVTVIDFVDQLRRMSPDGLIGFNVMSDGHHPNVRGYLALGTLVAKAIRQRFGDARPLQEIVDDADGYGAISSAKQFEVAISRGRWFTRLATWRYDPGNRLNLADARFREALMLAPQAFEPLLGLGMVQFLRGDAEGGERHIERARALGGDQADTYLTERWVRQVRERAHRLATANRS